MNRRRNIWGVAVWLLLLSGGLLASGGYISTAASVAAYGATGGYLITNLNELLKWNETKNQWELSAKFTPDMRQLDCLADGKRLVGTDTANKVRKWNGLDGTLSAWSQPRGAKEYEWVQHEHVTDATKGWLPGFPEIKTIESWDTPSLVPGDSWDKYLPIKAATAADPKKPRILIDKDANGYHRWHEKDIPYLIDRNQQSNFYIYYYGADEDEALTRMIDPPTSTHNIDDIEIKTISYDEDDSNLWGIGTDGKPYHWDNTGQEWVLRDKRSEELTESQKALQDLLRQEDDYYVRTTYIQGNYRPTLIILKDSLIMHLILGTLGSDVASELIIIIMESAKEKLHDFDNVLWRPRSRPQKIVHPNSDRMKKRIRENHYLERTLRSLNIIVSDDELGAYPSTHRRIRR